MKFVITAALLLLACGGSDQPARQPEATTTTGATNAPNDTSSVVPTQNSAPQNGPTQNGPTQNGATQMQATMGTAFTDAQIAAITDAANNGEVEQAKLALRRAKDPQVKAFAQMMVDHHGEALKSQHTLMSSLNLSPESNQMSSQLSSDSQHALSSLSGQAVGTDFDKAYIDLQCKEHKDVLEAFDTKLIPSAHNADLKKALSDFRPKVQEHLQRAQELQQMLAKK